MNSDFKPQKILFAAAAICVIAFVVVYYRIQVHNELRLGIFVGSNWNVPQGETYIIIDEVIRQFEKAHPNVKVTYVSGIEKEDYAEWLAEQFMDGNEPDVFFVLAEDFNLYASIGALMDLSPFIARDDKFDPGNYYPAAFRYGMYEETPYALPRESVLTFMFVNKTLLEREGIAMPKNDWTWTDFLDICRRVTKDTDGDGRLDQFGCYDYSWQQAAISNGLTLFREDGKASYFADQRMEETVQLMMELRRIHQSYDVNPKDFDMGRVAFRPFSFAEYRTYKPYPWRIKKYSSFEWDCVKMPGGSSGRSISVMDTLLVGMSSRTGNAELAWKFLKALCYDEASQQLILKKSQALPVRRGVVMSSEAQEIFLWESINSGAMTPADISKIMDEAVMPPKFKGYGDAILYADAEITKIIRGVVPFNNSLNRLQKEVNALLQQ